MEARDTAKTHVQTMSLVLQLAGESAGILIFIVYFSLDLENMLQLLARNTRVPLQPVPHCSECEIRSKLTEDTRTRSMASSWCLFW